MLDYALHSSNCEDPIETCPGIPKLLPLYRRLCFLQPKRVAKILRYPTNILQHDLHDPLLHILKRSLRSLPLFLAHIQFLTLLHIRLLLFFFFQH